MQHQDEEAEEVIQYAQDRPHSDDEADVRGGQMGKRRTWYDMGQISTQHTPADLNAKPLSRERRECLCEKIGFESSFFKRTD